MRIQPRSITSSRERQSLLLGSLGVLGFSFSLIATRAADADLGGTIVGLGRGLIAALLAGILLLVLHERPPPRRYWRGLVLVALGVVAGFPLLSSLALQSLPAAHGAVVAGLLPAATAVMAVLRANERPSRGFWMACALGVVSVLAFAVTEGGGRPQAGDLLLLLAVVLGGLGYAEGGRLARDLGGWRVICWALILAAPILAPVVGVAVVRHGLSARPQAWLGFGYVSVVSMFLAFFAWYGGLALGGVARISQLQLVQPVLTLTWAALLLGERVNLATAGAALVVILSAAVSRRTKISPRARLEIVAIPNAETRSG